MSNPDPLDDHHWLESLQNEHSSDPEAARVGAALRKRHLKHLATTEHSETKKDQLQQRLMAEGLFDSALPHSQPDRMQEWLRGLLGRPLWLAGAFTVFLALGVIGCHLREGLRAFAVDAIQAAELLDTKAKDIEEKRLKKLLGSGYGIFSGDEVTWATLIFTPERSRWVSKERWHPLQRGKMNPDGSYELKVPFNDHRELIMDILKYGEDCTVISPPELVEKVKEQLVRGLWRYQEQE